MATPQVGYLTDYTEEKLIKHLFGISTYTIPDLYLAVAVYDSVAGYTTGWGETGSAGAGTIEPDAYGDTNYHRIHVPASDWITAVGSSGAYAYSNIPHLEYHFSLVRVQPALAFPDPLLAWGNGAPRYMAFFDAATGGNCLTYHDISVSGPGSTIPRPGFNLSTPAESIYLGMPGSGFFDWDTTANPNGYYSAFGTSIVEGLLNHMVGKATYTPPSPFYLVCDSNTTGTEPDQLSVPFNDTAYARISCGSNWSAAQDGATGKWKVTNSAAFTFAACGLASAWNPGAYLLATSGTSGAADRIVDCGAGPPYPTFNNGDQLQAPAGTLQFFFG